MQQTEGEMFDEASSPSWMYGRITTVLQAKGFGFIRPDCELQHGLGYKYVHFYLNKAESEVHEGDQVMFISKDLNTGKPSAKIVRKVGSDAEMQITPGNKRRTRSEFKQRSPSSHRSLTPRNMICIYRRQSVTPTSFEDLDFDNKSDASDVHSINSDDSNGMAGAGRQRRVPQPRHTTEDSPRLKPKQGFMTEFRQIRGVVVEISGSSVA